MAVTAHAPLQWPDGVLPRIRRPLAAAAAILVAIDVIGLGVHWADTVNSHFATDSPPRAQPQLSGPEALVSDPAQTVVNHVAKPARPAEPFGCLAADSGCYPTQGPTTTPTPPASGTTPPPQQQPSPAPVPLAQVGATVPALGTTASVGVGDGGCTAVDLTVIALGDCPAPTGDGAVVVNLGGSLLGQK
ncbi:MAG TPA: hypothetical protein VMZ90_01200 [Vicinamibacterales bacterium]|nr:hypothetical protein [Vicinamibacterales bacterium]